MASVTAWEPSYRRLYRSGELRARAETAGQSLAACTLCPHLCKANRLAGERGVCRMTASPVVASWNAHHWEEPPVSGTRGSGTIFFSGCSGRCCFCQNYPISQLCHGNTMDAAGLARIMLELQNRGCHNINFVTPTHFVPQILEAVDLASARGLRLPLVYNSSGYDRVDTLRLLDGVFDIFLPDAKYADETIARQVSGYPGYVAHNRAALREMFRQVGEDHQLDEQGVLQRGMIVRHLVLPHDLSGTADVLAWIAAELSPRLHVSLMDQYFPAHRALSHPLLSRKLLPEEYDRACAAFDAAGLENGFCQDHDECAPAF